MNAFQTFATNRGLITGSAAHNLASATWDAALIAAQELASQYGQHSTAADLMGLHSWKTTDAGTPEHPALTPTDSTTALFQP
jgi:hypothetical protein